jgi:hypothetical protein
MAGLSFEHNPIHRKMEMNRTNDIDSRLDRWHYFSIVFGWVAAIVLGLVYNHLIRR